MSKSARKDEKSCANRKLMVSKSARTDELSQKALSPTDLCTTIAVTENGK